MVEAWRTDLESFSRSLMRSKLESPSPFCSLSKQVLGLSSPFLLSYGCKPRCADVSPCMNAFDSSTVPTSPKGASTRKSPAKSAKSSRRLVSTLSSFLGDLSNLEHSSTRRTVRRRGRRFSCGFPLSAAASLAFRMLTLPFISASLSEFADEIRPTLKTALLCVTGGFRSKKGMEEAIEGKSCDSKSNCHASSPPNLPKVD